MGDPAPAQQDLEHLLAEWHENQATGRIAEIYDEIRRFSGVPHVSSLQRFLATMPGVLEWAWDAVIPRFAAPETNAARASFRAAAREYAETSPEMTMFGQLILDAL